MQTLKPKANLKFHAIAVLVDFLLVGALLATAAALYGPNTSPKPLESSHYQGMAAR